MKTALALGVVAGLACSAMAEFTITATLVDSAPIGTAHTFATSENVNRYSNVTNFSGQAFANGGATAGITRMVADDINRTGSNGENLTDFTFSVANLNTVNVTARPRVRFYTVDPITGGPGTYLGGFSFNPIAFNASQVGTFSTGLLPVASQFAIPTSLWAGITFDNVGAAATTNAQLNLLGQGIYNPPTLGSSADVAFQTTAPGSFVGNNPAGAGFNFQGSPVANFGWSFNTVPTPGALAVLGLGGLVAGRRRR